MNLDAHLVPLKREKLYEGVMVRVKGLISTSELRVGDRLPSERELAQRLKVSRVVVREALRSLEQSGFIEVRSGSRGGAFVTHNLHKPLADSAHHLFQHGNLTLQHFFEARRAIECASVRLAAARATPRQIRRLKAINRRLLADLSDTARLRRRNAAFHAAVADISGNPLITLLVQALLDLLDTILPQPAQSVAFARNTFERHEAIIAAMEKRDVGLCERLMAADAEFTRRLSSGSRRVTAHAARGMQRGAVGHQKAVRGDGYA